MELLAAGRTAEVFGWDEGRVLKLDRLEWNGLSAIEASVLATVAEAGVAVPRPHEAVMVGDRHGLVIDRVDGPILADVVDAASDSTELAATWAAMHVALNGRVVVGLPDLVTGLADSLRASGLAPSLVAELRSELGDLDDGRRNLCHFDLHPGNVIVAPTGWVVIDWMTASTGPPDADFARSLVLDQPNDHSRRGQFATHAARLGMAARGLDPDRLGRWVRVVAGARLAEGFVGAYADELEALATGSRTIDEGGGS